MCRTLLSFNLVGMVGLVGGELVLGRLGSLVFEYLSRGLQCVARLGFGAIIALLFLRAELAPCQSGPGFVGTRQAHSRFLTDVSAVSVALVCELTLARGKWFRGVPFLPSTDSGALIRSTLFSVQGLGFFDQLHPVLKSSAYSVEWWRLGDSNP